MIFVLSALSMMSIGQANAAEEIQFIDCHFSNSDNNDHVVISMNDPQNGSFFYTTGILDSGEDQNTGKLSLQRVEESKRSSLKKEDTEFSAKWNTRQDGSRMTIEFLFSMPKSLVFKASDAFKADLQTTITDSAIAPLHSSDHLDCFARIYPKSK